MNDLKIYENGNDYVVANSPSDAVQIWNEYTREDWVDDLYGEVGDWTVVESDSFGILQEDMPRKEDEPENANVSKAKNGLWMIVAAPSDWVKHNDRGWLCSFDF